MPRSMATNGVASRSHRIANPNSRALCAPESNNLTKIKDKNRRDETVQPNKTKLILIDTNSNSSFLFYITLDVHFWYSRRQTSNCDTYHIANQGQLLLL